MDRSTVEIVGERIQIGMHQAFDRRDDEYARIFGQMLDALEGLGDEGYEIAMAGERVTPV